ncbi:MAG TPA: ABC transporter permease, partial [Actinomycetes bacterium]
LDFYVPGYIALVWAAVGLLALPVHLARYREDGVLRRLRASSAPRWVVLGSQFAVSFVVSLVGGGLVILAAALTYDIHAPRSVPGFLLAWLLCAALFGSLGLLFASIGSSRAALGAGLGAFFVMMMLSGTGPPPEVLTGAMQGIRSALPLTYAVRLMQDPWLGLSWSLTDTAAVLAFTLAALAATRLLFRWE